MKTVICCRCVLIAHPCTHSSRRKQCGRNVWTCALSVADPKVHHQLGSAIGASYRPRGELHGPQASEHDDRFEGRSRKAEPRTALNHSSEGAESCQPIRVEDAGYEAARVKGRGDFPTRS